MRAYILGLLIVISAITVLADSTDKFHCSVVGIGTCPTDSEFALSGPLGYYTSYRFQCYTLDLRFDAQRGVRANRIDFGGRFAIPTQEIFPSQTLCLRRKLGLDYEVDENNIARVYLTSDCPDSYRAFRRTVDLDSDRRLIAIWNWNRVPFNEIRVGFGSGDVITYNNEFTLSTTHPDNRLTRHTPNLSQFPSSNMRGGKGYSTRSRSVRIQYPEIESPSPTSRNYPFFEDYITLDAVLDMVGTHFGSGVSDGPDALVPFSLYNIRASEEYSGIDTIDIRQFANTDMDRDDIEAALRTYLSGYAMGGFIGATGDTPDGESCEQSGECQSGICLIADDNPTCQPRFHDCNQDTDCFIDNIGQASYYGREVVMKPSGLFVETFLIDYLLTGEFIILFMNIETPEVEETPESFNPDEISFTCAQYYRHLDMLLDDIAEVATVPELSCENIGLEQAKELVKNIHDGGGISGDLLVECDGGLRNMLVSWSNSLVDRCTADDLEYLLGSHVSKGTSYQPLSTLVLNLALEKETS